jgi:hypothetical protein
MTVKLNGTREGECVNIVSLTTREDPTLVERIGPQYPMFVHVVRAAILDETAIYLLSDFFLNCETGLNIKIEIETLFLILNKLNCILIDLKLIHFLLCFEPIIRSNANSHQGSMTLISVHLYSTFSYKVHRELLNAWLYSPMDTDNFINS